MSLHLTGADRIAAHARDEGTCESCDGYNYAAWGLYGVSLYSVSNILLCEECLFDMRDELKALLTALNERDVERSEAVAQVEH